MVLEKAERPHEEVLEQVNAALKLAPEDEELLDKKADISWTAPLCPNGDA